MGKVRVSTTIDAPPRRVWDEVRHLGRHVDWMDDAVAIRFTSHRTTGVGTTFDCDTKVGPVRLTDQMEVTEWRDGKAIGVRHVGMVTGSGRFTLRRARRGRTRFTWEERLTYPLWMGGRVGGVVGDRIMAHIWRKNLTTLKDLVEGDRR
ncbi:MAG: SRPBCC family protein [Iamia sp.]